MGPCSRTPSGPAVSTDCINRPDRRLHPTNATASIYLLQRGSHPQRTQVGHRAKSERCKTGSNAGCARMIRRMSPSGHSRPGRASSKSGHQRTEMTRCATKPHRTFIGAFERLNLVALQSIRHQQVTSPSRWNYFFSPVPVPVVAPGAVFIPVRRSSRRSVRAVRRS